MKIHFMLLENSLNTILISKMVQIKYGLKFYLVFVYSFLLACSLNYGKSVEKGEFRKPELVELIKLDSTFRLDIKYATDINFLGRAVYSEARAFLQKPAAEALVRVNKKLRLKGYGLLIFDGYRPWSVTKQFWDAATEEQREIGFIADPQKDSRHNRGCAVDLTLYDVKTGKQVTMPSEYDEFTERAHSEYAGGYLESLRLRDLLRSAMESEGFKVLKEE